MAFFQAVNIHRPALDGVVLDDLPRPLAELHGALIVHLEADGNDHLQIVVRDLAIDLACALRLNYSEFPNSCLFRKFTVGVDFFDMLIDSRQADIIQHCHHLLRQPDILVLVAHLDAGRIVTGRSDIGEVFCRRAAAGDLIFLFHGGFLKTKYPVLF